LVFLGPSPFGYENLNSSLLDFLGFSRPKRDLSMGYEGQTEQKFFSPFPPELTAPRRALRSWHADGQSCSWGEHNLVSDFLQGAIMLFHRGGWRSLRLPNVVAG
jgi:hypothetical protein